MEDDERPLPSAIKMVLSHYWQELRQRKLYVALAFIVPGIGSILVFYVPPLIIAKILARFGNSQANITADDLLPYILAFVGLWALGEALWRVALHFLIKLQTSSIMSLYRRAMDFLLEKDLAFFHDNFTGSLTKKAVAYAKNFEEVTDTLCFSVASNVLPLAFISVVLWRFSPWIVVALYVFLVFALILLIPMIRRRQKMVDAREASSNVLSGHIADAITNMSVVHAFAHEQQELKIHKQNIADYAKKLKRTWDYQNLRIDMVISPLYVLANAVGLVLALSLSGHHGLSLEAVFITFSYFATFTRVLWEFNQIYRRLETNITDAAQFTQLLLDEPKIKDPVAPEVSHLKQGAINFEDVTFTYTAEDKERLLQHFDLHIPSGQKVGLVGRSGGGKTTLTKLLLRFIDINDGAICIDGQDIRAIKRADLRRNIAYVPQEPMLFHRSLHDNIAYAKPGASSAEVREAARKASALEFIEKLPKGFDTLVGERGIKLSGGQRQRIAIARAILKDAPILVLDEATSALDSESEKTIQAALRELMRGRTTIAIAHRLSTIQNMDRIIVLEEGEIIEDGSHQRLLARNGTYALLWRHQTGGFLSE